jgi:hypothetical protein
VSLQISSLDPEIAIAIDESSNQITSFSTFPRRIDATQEIQDFDTPGFRLHWRFPIRSVDGPTYAHKFPKFKIVGIAKYNAEPARDFRFFDHRKVVIAASLYPNIDLPPSTVDVLDNLRNQFDSLFEGHKPLFLSNIDLSQVRERTELLSDLRLKIRSASSNDLVEAISILNSSCLHSDKLARLRNLAATPY